MVFGAIKVDGLKASLLKMLIKNKAGEIYKRLLSKGWRKAEKFELIKRAGFELQNLPMKIF